MPFAVTHVLVAIIIAELLRDYVFKKKFPLHYVLIAGIAGMLPDIDILLVLFDGMSISSALNGGAMNLHPSFTHSILWIPIFLMLALTFLWLEKKGKIRPIERIFTKHKLKISGILFVVALGIAVHLALDSTLTGFLRVGFFTEPIGLNLIPPTPIGNMITAGIDAVLLVLWLIHEELRHKISGFI
ncbi:metal-dependent hydrolase [Candidatus Pacearchaeota archaeon]|nr:metal-dependent hydrolase [Candidatus Pacearchaeota archaeon]